MPATRTHPTDGAMDCTLNGVAQILHHLADRHGYSPIHAASVVTQAILIATCPEKEMVRDTAEFFSDVLKFTTDVIEDDEDCATLGARSQSICDRGEVLDARLMSHIKQQTGGLS